MSSNKTIIPGMENLYEEPTYPNKENMNTGTCVPEAGMAPSSSVINTKPIVGFLYSISKSLAGEFWPLRIGSNTIGRSKDCDVCLEEATVSEQHAVLVVRQMKNPEKLIASICDARSTCGTMINGQSLGFDQVECVNNDIITIGEHYDLLFILIDSRQIGLNVCRDFIPTKKPSTPAKKDVHNMNAYSAPTGGNKFTLGFDDINTSSQVEVSQEDDGSISKPGGTIFM